MSRKLRALCSREENCSEAAGENGGGWEKKASKAGQTEVCLGRKPPRKNRRAESREFEAPTATRKITALQLGKNRGEPALRKGGRLWYV